MNQKKISRAAPTAKEINEAHRLARTSAETAVEHAIRCGQMLVEKKTELDRGEFDGWIEKYCDFGRRMAYSYIKAAKSCNALHDSSAGAAAAAAFPSLRGLLGIESKAEKKLSQPNTSARSVKGAVMNPPESAAQGSEAGNRNTPVGVETGQVRPPAPSPEPDDPKRPDDVDEDSALAAAEADYARRIAAVMEADDKLAEANAQLKQQAALISTLETTRDGYMRGKEAVTKMLQSEQRKVAKLEKELSKLREENESLRERVAIMEQAA